MNWTIIILVTLSYVIGMPILLRLIAHMQKKLFIDRKLEKAPKNKAAQLNLPKPIWPVWKERIAYTKKDDRDAKVFGTRKKLYYGLLLIGLIITIVAAVIEMWLLLPLAYIIYFVATFYAIYSSKDVLDTRKKIMTKMFQIASSKGLIDRIDEDQMSSVIEVVEWRDIIKPNKVKIQVRTEFNADAAEGFLRQWNQVFGTETAWVASDEKKPGPDGKEMIVPGWNFAEGEVTLKEVPPLPMMAPWNERYVLDPNIAWSFFPIALGVENGVELTNPETGEIENVLGFDLSGEQSKMTKKTGVKVSEKIVTSPMVLCSGGTGGGKSLPIDLVIERTVSEK